MSKLLRFNMERDDLSERLGGGLPPGSLIMMEGVYGAGKSIIAQRIVQGLVQNEHSVTYVSTELTTAGFLAQMESLKYDVEKGLLEERLVFIPSYPVLGARAPRTELLERLVKARLMYTKEVVVFDTFSKFLADHLRAEGDAFTSVEKIEGVLYLFKRLTSMGKTIILTFEEGQVPDDIVASFKDAADVLFHIKFEITGGTAARMIIVKRMSRAQGRFGEIIGFRVEPGVGIVIEIKSVV